MKLKQITYLGVLSLVLLFFAACAGAPEPAPTEEPATQQEEKREPVIVNVPMIQKETVYIGETILDSYSLYQYENDRLVSVDVLDSFNEAIEYIVFEYDGGDQPSKRLTYGPDEQLRSMRVYAYDAEGNKVREEVYNRNEALQTVSVYQYDDAGNRVRWEVRDSGDALMAYTEYLIEDGMTVRVNTFSADGVLRDYFLREYEDGGVVKESKFDEDGTSAGSVEYEYTNGRVSEERHYRPNGSLERKISFEYDNEGSIIREVYLRADDSVEQVVTREFSYREELIEE